MLPFENFVHCEKELWVHWGERWHNWFNIKFSFFRWNFFMVWWMDQQFLGMWLDSNHHHGRHKKCRRVNRHLDATVSLYSLAIRLCDVHNKVDRKRRSSKLWNRRANNKKDHDMPLQPTNQKAALSSGTFYRLFMNSLIVGNSLIKHYGWKLRLNYTSEASRGYIFSFGAKIVIFEVLTTKIDEGIISDWRNILQLFVIFKGQWGH